MFRIGDFSRLSRVSVKMLRHYDELGLLPPARVDPDTDYRYYSADQLPRLHTILALKELGFSLEQIGTLLTANLSVEQMRRMLTLRRAEIEQQLRAQQARLLNVETWLQQVDRSGALPAHEVIVRRAEPQTVAAIRAILPSFHAIERLFDEVETWASQRRCRAAAPPIMFYHDAEYREQDVDVEVAVPIVGSPRGSGRVRVIELPGAAMMACVVHTGSYAGISRANEALFSWIAAQEYRVIGPLREVYMRFGVAQTEVHVPSAFLTDLDSEYVTEIQVPIASVHRLDREE